MCLGFFGDVWERMQGVDCELKTSASVVGALNFRVKQIASVDRSTAFDMDGRTLA